jgi:hypothetical protein
MEASQMSTIVGIRTAMDLYNLKYYDKKRCWMRLFSATEAYSTLNNKAEEVVEDVGNQRTSKRDVQEGC